MPRLPLQLRSGQALGGHHLARLLDRAPAHQRLRLRKAIGDKQLVVMRQLRLVALRRDHEFARHHPRALVDQLVEGVLAVGAAARPRPPGRCPLRRACRPSARACRSIPSPAAADRPATAPAAGRRAAPRGSHGRRPARARCRPAPAAPAGSRHQSAARKCTSIACPPRRKASKGLRADRDHQRQPDGPPHRIAPADPILEAEHPLRRNAKGRGLIARRAQRRELLFRIAAVIGHPGPRGARHWSSSRWW